MTMRLHRDRDLLVNSIRYSNYRIKNNHLWGIGEWDVFPLDFAGFYEKLMTVTSDDLLVKFAREHGFLGYRQLLDAERGLFRWRAYRMDFCSLPDDAQDLPYRQTAEGVQGRQKAIAAFGNEEDLERRSVRRAGRAAK